MLTWFHGPALQAPNTFFSPRALKDNWDRRWVVFFTLLKGWHTLMCLSSSIAWVTSLRCYCSLLKMPFTEFAQRLPAFCRLTYTKGALQREMNGDVLLRGVVGFRVDLDKVIFLHDTFPCQSLIVLIFETLNKEKKKNIQVVSFAPCLLNQHLPGIF